MKNFVICLICKKKFKVITVTHLKSHNITMKEYRKLFPEAELQNEEKNYEHSLKISGENNYFYNTNLLEIWTNKFGREQATKMWEEKYKKFGEKISGENNWAYGLTGELSCHYGKKRTKETKNKISIANKGVKKSTEHKNKLSKTRKEKCASGEIEPWNKGETKETDSRIAKCGEKQSITKKLNPEKYSGKNCGAYGKSSSKESGIGLKGYVLDKFFRNSLEMRIFLYFYENDIKFKLTKQRIKYVDKDEKEKTYLPDLEIDGIIYEIKPKGMLKIEKIQFKLQVLEKYCFDNDLKYGIITEKTYDISFINKNYR